MTFWLLCTGISLSLYAAGGLVFVIYVARGRRAERARRTRAASASPHGRPGLSLLKPIKGEEEDLDANLESFFAQRYRPLEVVFSSVDPDDPGIVIARRVADRHPDIPARFVVSDPHYGYNPKVGNLAAALHAASYDLVFQSDANVRLDEDYLTRVVDELHSQHASLLTSLIVGCGEKSVGAAFENAHLTSFIAPGLCAARVLARVTCVIGKSMLFRKSELDTLGGIESVRNVLAEDFLIGMMYQQACRHVVLSANTVQNLNARMPVSRSLSRHSRWAKMRAVISPASFAADLAFNPVAIGLLAWAASGLHPVAGRAWLALAAGKVAVDNLAMRWFRGSSLPIRYFWITPLKDLAMAAVWGYALFSRRIQWRGTTFSVTRGSTLVPRAPTASGGRVQIGTRPTASEEVRSEEPERGSV
jgi:ceramide glucosyltransferase